MAQTQTRKQKILGDVKRARRRRTLATTAVIAIIMIAIVLGIILFQKPPPSILGTPIPQSLYSEMSGVSNATLNAASSQVGQTSGVTPLVSVTGNSLTSNGKPEVLYIGAEFCPYCAAERWGIIVALSKFGTFSGLTYMQSSATDVDPSTPTFSFVQASYTSQYITFVSRETSDRDQHPLQSLSSDQQNLINQYDCNQNNQCGGIPFLDIGGKYMITPPPNNGPNEHSGSQFDPGVLSGQNWTQIGSQLDTQSSEIALKIGGTADTIISAICHIDGSAPSSVCTQSYASITQAPPGPLQMPPE